MTNREAIEVLQDIKEHPSMSVELSEEYEALDLAIKALEDAEEWNKLKLLCANEGVIVYKVKEGGS